MPTDKITASVQVQSPRSLLVAVSTVSYCLRWLASSCMPMHCSAAQPPAVPDKPTARTPNPPSSETMRVPDSSPFRRCFSQQANLGSEQALRCHMEALGAHLHQNTAALQEPHTIRKSSEHLNRSDCSGNGRLTPLTVQGLDGGHSIPPLARSSCSGGHTRSTAESQPPFAAAQPANFRDLVTSIAPFACAACASVVAAFVCRIIPQCADSTSCWSSFPASSSTDSSTACMHSPTADTLSSALAQSWLARMLACALAIVAFVMARHAFAVAALPIRVLVVSCMGTMCNVLGTIVVVVMLLPQELRPRLWTLFIALPTVRTLCHSFSMPLSCLGTVLWCSRIGILLRAG